MSERADVVVIGGGHNGLVAATLLARAGLDVVVCEAAEVLGGAARTEAPFAAVPELRHSTGAYLLGLMPPELIATLGLDLPLLRRDPHYALPAPVGSSLPSLVFGADAAANAAALEAAFSPADARADAALQGELAQLREDLAPAWLAEPLSLEDTAERYLRPALREVFVAACQGSVVDYLDRFGFASERLLAMYAVTDGISGLSAGVDDPGTGHNFLAHNMGRLPGSDGTWMIVRGGMGTVASALADAARAAGARLLTGTAVRAVDTTDGVVSGVDLDRGRIGTAVVLAACDPFRLPALVGPALPADLRERLDRIRRPGVTFKLNLALRDVPRFPALSGLGNFTGTGGATAHLMPGEDRPLAAVRSMWADVQAGRLPEFPTIEWYLHTTVDPSLQDPAGHHSSALFVQSVPHVPAGSSWEAELPGYTEHLLAVCDRFAPGTSASVADTLALPPPGIEARFGITGGHIHHVDNTIAFADRVPYATGLPGLYAGSAGCHPAGSVIGAAGHNAAARILADLGRVDRSLSR
ncbi:MAG TPA: NAD(P)/FAD-dependent oxidoreductase [Sporichthya sp.]|nr:NAD(P)/FAD-dependent oxidoreductase [Sporichthya sp.]